MNGGLQSCGTRIGCKTPKVTQPLYGAFVKSIVKHVMYFTIGMRDNAFRVLTKEVAKSNVYMKATKDSKFKILKE